MEILIVSLVILVYTAGIILTTYFMSRADEKKSAFKNSAKYYVSENVIAGAVWPITALYFLFIWLTTLLINRIDKNGKNL